MESGEEGQVPTSRLSVVSSINVRGSNGLMETCLTAYEFERNTEVALPMVY